MQLVYGTARTSHRRSINLLNHRIAIFPNILIPDGTSEADSELIYVRGVVLCGVATTLRMNNVEAAQDAFVGLTKWLLDGPFVYTGTQREVLTKVFSGYSSNDPNCVTPYVESILSILLSVADGGCTKDDRAKMRASYGPLWKTMRQRWGVKPQ